MEEIIAAQQQVTATKQRLHDAVTAARSHGHTWKEIGDALDMSRQAAFKRFGKPTNPADGDALTRRPVTPLLDSAERAFGLLAAADYERLHQSMTPETAKALTADLLTETWTKVLSEVGHFEACRNTYAELPDGTLLDADESVLGVAVAATTLVFEAGELLGRIAFDENQKIVGILIVPLDHGKLPF